MRNPDEMRKKMEISDKKIKKVLSKSDIISIYDKSPKIAVLESTFAARQKSQMTGLVGSSLSLWQIRCLKN